MRVLVIYAHPDPDSLNGAIHREILTALSAAGHEVDDIDLYADGFDPVLSAEERRDYFEPDLNRARVADYAARIEAAEGLVFCFPTWCLGPPAILKGFFDRVMVPGGVIPAGRRRVPVTQSAAYQAGGGGCHLWSKPGDSLVVR